LIRTIYLFNEGERGRTRYKLIKCLSKNISNNIITNNLYDKPYKHPKHGTKEDINKFYDVDNTLSRKAYECTLANNNINKNDNNENAYGISNENYNSTTKKLNKIDLVSSDWLSSNDLIANSFHFDEFQSQSDLQKLISNSSNNIIALNCKSFFDSQCLKISNERIDKMKR